jgi:transposase-like protein
MTTITPTNTTRQQNTPCPYCGRPYRTLLERRCGIQIDGGIKHSLPLSSHWRCLSCGKSYTTQDE